MCWRDGLVVRTKCCKCVKPRSTVVNLSFCDKGPWNSIEHKIRKRIILTFTFFRLDSWKNLLFTSPEKYSDVRVRHRQKDY